jgi:membrane-bound serine protease (ClpP class)
MWEWIIGLFVLGVLFVVAEFFLPGLILGICGGAALVAAVALAYQQHGFGVGSVLLGLVLLVVAVGFVMSIKAFPHSPIGRQMALHTAVKAPTDHPQLGDLLGTEGTTLTPLRPSGRMMVDDRQIDVVSESSFIAAQTRVRVIHVEGGRVVVRPVAV